MGLHFTIKADINSMHYTKYIYIAEFPRRKFFLTEGLVHTHTHMLQVFP